MTLSGGIGTFRQLRRGTGGFSPRLGWGRIGHWTLVHAPDLSQNTSPALRTVARVHGRAGGPIQVPRRFAFLLAPPSPYDPNGAAYAASGSLWCCLESSWPDLSCFATGREFCPMAARFFQWPRPCPIAVGCPVRSSDRGWLPVQRRPSNAVNPASFANVLPQILRH